jgi:hypothetical protein
MATYQTFAPPISDTLAHFKAWAQFFGAGFTTIGWTAQTGHGEVVATGTGATYAWTSASLPTTALLAPQAYTFKGAFVGGTTYVGGNTANLATEVDVVTDGGVTYQHITASSALATAPGADTTNWQPLIFEIWKSNGSNSASLPIYVKLIYTVQTTAGTAVRYRIGIGTGVDVNGNLINPLPLTQTNPVWDFLVDAATGTSTTSAEMDFAGDADNFRYVTFRGAASPAALVNCVVVDRSKTSAGLDTNAFAFVGLLLDNSNSGITYSFIIANSNLTNVPLSVTRSGWAGVVFGGNCTTSMAAFGGVPTFPVFPLPGYLANPCLGVIGLHKLDGLVDGTQIPVWMYGQSHNYLVATSVATAMDNQTNGIYPAILWE